MNLKIKKEFSELIPPLTSEEYIQLEKNCIADGIRDRIITWEGFIVDGHNRYKIAQDNKLNFKTEEVAFENENEVILWIIKNQLGRRNLSNYDRGILALKFKEFISAKAKEKQKEGGGAVHQKSDKAVIDTKKELSKMAGVSHDTIMKVEHINNNASSEIKDKVKKQEISINQAYKRTKQNDIKENLDSKLSKLPSKKYRILYADPPWKYGNTMPEYFKEQADHYTLMSIEELCLMDIKNITEENAVLFLWVTSPILEESFKIINAWGFKYKTSFVWDKIKHNMGHYNSVRHEFLLVCVKGSCQPDINKLFDSVQSIERTKHSEKPEYFREIIDTIYTKGKRIELFARKKVNNWDVYGNEIS